MPFSTFIKKYSNKLPIEIGRILATIPFEYRPGIGNLYNTRKKEMIGYKKMSLVEKKEFILNRFYNIIDYSYHNIEFYKWFYDKNNFDISKLKSYNDIKRVPIINKSILQKFELEKRSTKYKNRYIENTGGSSGKPLSFYILPDSIGHEWAHMHTVWSKLGYSVSDLKLVLGGRSGVIDNIEYDFVRHSLSFDIYSDFDLVASKLYRLASKHPIKYLHGYPSAIYELANYCKNNKDLLSILKKSLKGALLGSEFPHVKFRKTIENTFNIPSISWYGHSERAILAYEKNVQFEYHPFQTYGYTEAIINENNKFELLGTTYYNYASPLIRYSTEDTVTNITEEKGLLKSFNIVDGRSGEFVIDRKGKYISLTGLIFGRHHKLFDFCLHLQVYQKIKGQITILYVTNSNITDKNAAQWFDKNNIDMSINFKKINEPIRTPSGKINILVKDL